MTRLITLLGLVLAVLLGGSGVALAHNTLVSSDPRDGAQVETGPKQVRLTFDQPVREGYNTVRIVGPNQQHWADGRISVEGNSVTVPVRELGPTGEYTVGYRVLSNDGHSVTGKVGFTLTEPGNGTPAAPPEQAGEQTTDSGGGVPVWPWIVGAVALIGLGVVLALRLGKPAK